MNIIKSIIATFGLCLLAQGCRQIPANGWQNSTEVAQVPRYEKRTQTPEPQIVPTTPPQNVQLQQPNPWILIWQAYRQFDYQQVIERTSGVIESRVSAAEKGMAYMLRGASLFLLNERNAAQSDFRAAKQCGIQTPDAKIFPADMIEAFNKSK